jgi:hypothetical protein
VERNKNVTAGFARPHNLKELSGTLFPLETNLKGQFARKNFAICAGDIRGPGGTLHQAWLHACARVYTRDIDTYFKSIHEQLVAGFDQNRGGIP